MTQQTLTPYKLLSETEKKARRDMYAAQRKERGTKEELVRLAELPKIRNIKGDNKMAVFRLVINKEDADPVFFTASAFIKKGKDSLEAFYRSLKVGQLVSVEYVISKEGYTNIYNLMDRSKHDTHNIAHAEVKAEPAFDMDAPLDF